MKRFSGIWSAFIVASFAIVALAASAGAATRNIRSTNTSTGPGICSITIESFGLNPESQNPNRTAVFNINVSIPSGSTANNSATLIRNDVDAALPGDYTVTIPGGFPNFVRIERSPGTFTMSISENVPTQVIEEANPPLPGMGTAAGVTLSVLLLGAGIVLLRRSRRAIA